jgi:hypothetical protein
LIAIVDGAGSWDSGMEAASHVYHVLEGRWRTALPVDAGALERDLLAATGTIPEEMRQGDSFSFAAAMLCDESVQIIAAGRFGVLNVVGERAAQIFSPGTWVMEQVAAGILTQAEALAHPLRNVCIGGHVSSGGTELFVSPSISLESGDVILIAELALFQKLLLAPIASWRALSAERLQKLSVEDRGMPSAVVKVYRNAA